MLLQDSEKTNKRNVKNVESRAYDEAVFPAIQFYGKDDLGVTKKLVVKWWRLIVLLITLCVSLAILVAYMQIGKDQALSESRAQWNPAGKKIRVFDRVTEFLEVPQELCKEQVARCLKSNMNVPAATLALIQALASDGYSVGLVNCKAAPQNKQSCLLGADLDKKELQVFVKSSESSEIGTNVDSSVISIY